MKHIDKEFLEKVSYKLNSISYLEKVFKNVNEPGLDTINSNSINSTVFGTLGNVGAIGNLGTTGNTATIGNFSKHNLSFKNEELTEDDIEEEDYNENRPQIYKDFNYTYLSERRTTPLKIETETGISHLVTGENKIEEFPISVNLNLRNNFELTKFNKTIILIFNTKSKKI